MYMHYKVAPYYSSSPIVTMHVLAAFLFLAVHAVLLTSVNLSICLGQDIYYAIKYDKELKDEFCHVKNELLRGLRQRTMPYYYAVHRMLAKHLAKPAMRCLYRAQFYVEYILYDLMAYGRSSYV